MLVGINAFRLLHQDMGVYISTWIERVHADEHNRIIHAVISRLLQIDDRKLRLIGVGTFIYAALFLTEGTGLMLAKRWGEILTVISTSLLIPVEVYEIFRRHTHHAVHTSVLAAKIVIFVLNLVVVIYLVRRLPREVAPGRAVDSSV